MYSQNTKFIPFEFHLRRTQSIFEKLMLVNRHVHRKKRSLGRVKTKPSIISSYIHHEVLDCFSFFCCFEFLGTCEFRVPHNSPDSGLKKLTQQLVSSVVHLCQGVNNIRFAVTPSLRRFEFFQSLLSRHLYCRSFVLHGKSGRFISMDCVKNTFRVNDATTSLGNFLVICRVVIASLHDFKPQDSYEFVLFLCSSLCRTRCTCNSGTHASVPRNRTTGSSTPVLGPLCSCWPMTHRQTKQTLDPKSQDNATCQTLHNAPVARVDSNPRDFVLWLFSTCR